MVVWAGRRRSEVGRLERRGLINGSSTVFWFAPVDMLLL
jgi:hypothetical protein